MKNKDWQEEYCKKFGLCESKGKCQCREELRFIREVIKQAEERERNRIVKEIEDNFLLVNEWTMTESIQNNRVRDIITLINQNNE